MPVPEPSHRLIAESSFDTGEVVLNYAESRSSGPPLVLLHGDNASWQAFETIIPDLAAGSHLFLPDLRGHGASGRTPGRYTLQDYTADIGAFLGGVVPEPAFLFGHSLGGIVAQLVAAQRGDRVRGLIIGDSPLDKESWRAIIDRDRAALMAWRDLCGGRVPFEEVVETLKDAPVQAAFGDAQTRMRDVFGEDNLVFPWLAENLYRSDPGVLTMLCDDFEQVAEGFAMDAVLPAIRCPVLLLQADPSAGGVMADEDIERALALLPYASHVRLEGLSHTFHNERKEPVLEAVRPFLHALQTR